MSIKIRTTLGENPRVIAFGGNMFRICIDTPDVKHPWSENLWTGHSSDETSLLLMSHKNDKEREEEEKLRQKELKLHGKCNEDDYDNINRVLQIEGLPELKSKNWWGAVILPSTRWDLEIIIYPVFCEDEQ